MAALQCVCGGVFTASCDVEPAVCVAWLLLLASVVVHVVNYCSFHLFAMRALATILVLVPYRVLRK